MSAATRELEKLIVSRQFAHGGNPVTRWMASNVAVAQDPAGNLKPAKEKSTERIDGIVALIMALGRAMVVQEEPQPQYQVFFSEELMGHGTGEIIRVCGPVVSWSVASVLAADPFWAYGR